MRKDFLNKIIQLVAESFKNPSIVSSVPNCERYTFGHHDSYIEGAMPDELIADYEEHCGTCKSCQQAIFESHQEQILEEDEEEVAYLYKRTLETFVRIEKSQRTDTFDIIAQLKDSMLSILETTGEVLLSPAMSLAMRGNGANKCGEKSEILKVVKDIKSPPISIQVTIEKQSFRDDILMKLSFYSHELNDFVSGVEINFDNGDKKIQEVSDENGEAVIAIESQLDSIIDCKISDLSFVLLNLKIEEPSKLSD